jgi:hypothetical protein
MSIFLGETIIKTFCASDCNQAATAQRQVATQSLLLARMAGATRGPVDRASSNKAERKKHGNFRARAPRSDSVSAIDLAKRRSLSGLDKILLACRHGSSSPAVQEPNTSQSVDKRSMVRPFYHKMVLQLPCTSTMYMPTNIA